MFWRRKSPSPLVCRGPVLGHSWVWTEHGGNCLGAPSLVCRRCGKAERYSFDVAWRRVSRMFREAMRRALAALPETELRFEDKE